MTKKIITPILITIGRILQVLLLFILVLGIMTTIVGAMLGISMIKVAQSAPDVNPNNILLSLDQNSKIYDKDGKLIESVAYDEYREIVKIEEIPNYLQKAFISIEDERFYFWFSIYLFVLKILFIYERHTQRERERESI